MLTKVHTETALYNSHMLKRIPPFISPLVHIADIDRVVMVVTTEASRTIAVINPIPACPVSHGSLRYKITPHILRRHGINTPLHQPNFSLGRGKDAFTSISSAFDSCKEASSY